MGMASAAEYFLSTRPAYPWSVYPVGLPALALVAAALVALTLWAYLKHPQATRKLVMLDVTHPHAGFAAIPLLPGVGTFGDKVDDGQIYLWWFAFHQVKGLPEQLLEGRAHLEQEWFFHYLLKDDAAIDTRDRAVYAAAYASRDAIRAGNAWYQAFPQDIVDDGTYAKLEMPVLGLGGPSYGPLKATLESKATDVRVIKVEGSGHCIQEEKPEVTIRHIEAFLR
jgi:pimeloyl-ACP methyl ester carboxylesterase